MKISKETKKAITEELNSFLGGLGDDIESLNFGFSKSEFRVLAISEEDYEEAQVLDEARP